MATISVSASPGNNDTATVSGTGQVGAALSVNPSNIVFGDVDVGSTSAVTDVVLTNNGDAATGAIAMPTSTNPDFRVVAPSVGPACSWPVTLAGGGTCRFGVTFLPSVTGSASTTISLSASPGGGASVSASGTGQTAATLDVSPATYSFGPVYLNQSRSATFTVKNTGTRASSALGIAVSGLYFSNSSVANDCTIGQILAGGASCTVQVTFAPTATAIGATGMLTATITGSTDSSALSGDGLRPGTLTIVENMLDFGLVHVGGTSNALRITFKNTGDEPLTGLFSYAVPAGEFQVAGGGSCTSQLQPGATCFQFFNVTPAAGGPRSGNLGGSASSAGAGTTVAEVPASAMGAFRVALFVQATGSPTSEIQIIGRQRATDHLHRPDGLLRDPGRARRGGPLLPQSAAGLVLPGLDRARALQRVHGANACDFVLDGDSNETAVFGCQGTVHLSDGCRQVID